MTHRPPQLFDPDTNAWRSTMDFQQGDRMPNGGHADHELQMLPDGRVAAIGYKSFDLDPGRMLEIHDPSSETWSFRRGPAADPLPRLDDHGHGRPGRRHRRHQGRLERRDAHERVEPGVPGRSVGSGARCLAPGSTTPRSRASTTRCRSWSPTGASS